MGKKFISDFTYVIQIFSYPMLFIIVFICGPHLKNEKSFDVCICLNSSILHVCKKLSCPLSKGEDYVSGQGRP